MRSLLHNNKDAWYFFLVASSIGLYTNDVNRSVFSTGCLFYTAHCLVSIAFLKTFVSNEERLRWFYDHVGERRVKHKLFNSPILAALGSASMRTMLGGTMLEATTHYVRNAIHVSNCHTQAAEIRMGFEVDKAELERSHLADIRDPNLSKSYVENSKRDFKKHLEGLRAKKDLAINSLNRSPVYAGGIVSELINADTTQKAMEVAGTTIGNFGRRWGRSE